MTLTTSCTELLWKLSASKRKADVELHHLCSFQRYGWMDLNFILSYGFSRSSCMNCCRIVCVEQALHQPAKFGVLISRIRMQIMHALQQSSFSTTISHSAYDPVATSMIIYESRETVRWEQLVTQSWQSPQCVLKDLQQEWIGEGQRIQAMMGLTLSKLWRSNRFNRLWGGCTENDGIHQSTTTKLNKRILLCVRNRHSWRHWLQIRWIKWWPAVPVARPCLVVKAVLKSKRLGCIIQWLKEWKKH